MKFIANVAGTRIFRTIVIFGVQRPLDLGKALLLEGWPDEDER